MLLPPVSFSLCFLCVLGKAMWGEHLGGVHSGISAHKAWGPTNLPAKPMTSFWVSFWDNYCPQKNLLLGCKSVWQICTVLFLSALVDIERREERRYY